MADQRITVRQGEVSLSIAAGDAEYMASLGWVADAAPKSVPGDSEQEPAELKGKALDEALKEAGLPLDGRADEKRARYAEYLASEEPADEPVDEPVDGSGDAE